MKREIRDRWCAELRSGRRKQGFGRLEDGNGRQCSLAVLADVCGVPKRYDPEKGHYFYRFSDSTEVVECPPGGFQDLTHKQLFQMIVVNDVIRMSLPRTADWIEQNIPVEE